MNKTYQVVITGISDNYSKAQVSENLANLFKTSVDNIPNILNQSRYIIKKNLDLITAKKYQSSIQQQGCICVIEAEADLDLTIEDTPEAEISNVAETITNKSVFTETLPATEKNKSLDKEHKFCRACGFKLPRIAKFCRSCGSAQSNVTKSLNLTEENTKPDRSSILSQTSQSQTVAPIEKLTAKEPSNAVIASNLEEIHADTPLKSSSAVKITIAGILVIAISAIFYGIWSNGKARAIPVASKPTQVLAQPSLTAAPTPAAEYYEDSSDTVAGKFTIRTFNNSNTDRVIFLNGKEIEKCINDNQHSICDGEFLSVAKVFNIADKTILLTSYVSGSSCPATFQFFTVSKDGNYQRSEDFGNCAELGSDSAVTSDSKIVVTLPTLEQNMMGNEVWTYQNGKVTGPVKAIKPKFNIDVNKARRIIAYNETYNQVTGEIVKEGESYFLKFDSPALIVNKMDNNQSNVHDGDYVDKFDVPKESFGNTKPALSLGKGIFEIIVSCGNVGCGIDKIKVHMPNEASNTISAPDIQPSTASEVLNKNENH